MEYFFSREQLEVQARAQEYFKHLEAQANYVISTFFIPPGTNFVTWLTPEQFMPLTTAVPYAVDQRRYADGSFCLN